jgi:predicted nucleic acid-binding protein
MTLDDIPSGTVVLLDANILIYARRGASVQCQRLLARCAAREIRGCLTTIAVAEFCHRRMMQEAQSLGLAGSNPAKALSQNPALLGQLSQYRRDVEDLLAGDLTLLSLDAADLGSALELQRQHRLLTNDSLHLAAALRANIPAFATNDPGFDLVPSLILYKPDDVV